MGSSSASSLSGVYAPPNKNNYWKHPPAYRLSSPTSANLSTLQHFSLQNLKVRAAAGVRRAGSNIKRKQNGDYPSDHFQLPVQNYCQHNTSTLGYWTIQSGCDG